MRGPRIQLFDLSNDLEWDKNLQKVRKGTTNDVVEMVFDPEDFKADEERLTMQRHKLDEAELLEYARLATELRQRFRAKAAMISQSDPDGEHIQKEVLSVD